MPEVDILPRSAPITVSSPALGDYVFSLEPTDYLDRLDRLYLYDADYDLMTDLLESDYTTDVTEGVTRGRFSLRTVYRMPGIATDIENGYAEALTTDDLRVTTFSRDIIVIDAPADETVYCFDATGRLIEKSQNLRTGSKEQKARTGNDLRFTVPAAGVYILRSGNLTKRVIVK